MPRRSSAFSLLALFLVTALQLHADPFGVRVAFDPAGGSSGRLTLEWAVPDGHYLYDDMLEVVAESPVRLRLVEKTPAEMRFDAVTEADRAVYANPVRLIYDVEEAEPSAFRLKVSYQGCAGTLCFPPETRLYDVPVDGRAPVERPADHAGPATASDWAARFQVRDTAEGYMETEPFLAFLKGSRESEGVFSWRRWLAGGGWLGFLIILLGGLLLNLTPCVLPLIPINLALIGAGVRAGSRPRGALLGSAYGLGMAVSYGALGIVVVLTGTLFGALNVSPWFNLVFALLFLGLALAMLGVFNLDLSRFQPAPSADGRTPKRGPAAFLLAFSLGALSALLAGACVAPIVVAVLALAAERYAAGLLSGLFLPLILGLGMALPWPFAGAGLTVLPKPGRWMAALKIVMGCAVLYLAGLYARDAWIGFSNRRNPADAVGALELAMSRSAASRRPLFINFGTASCSSCLAMKRTTLREPAVVEALKAFEEVEFQADRLSDPAVREVLNRYGVRGFPTYVILDPK